MIQLRQATKVYPRRGNEVRAIDGVDWRLERGAFAIIRGKSGSGKTTLLYLIAGLTRPSAGEVEVAGTNLTRLDGASLAIFRAHHVGVVFQLFYLIPYLTVWENVLVPTLAGEVRGDRRRAMTLLEEFGLGDRLTHRPPELSAGERQRTALARALFNHPQLLLADEPTGNLDPESARGVIDGLQRYHQDGGTVVLVTHNESVDVAGAQEYLLEAGKLVGGR